MAYSQNIVRGCQRCRALADREVFNSRNASHGFFCRRHAMDEVIRLNREETKDDARPTPENQRLP